MAATRAALALTVVMMAGCAAASSGPRGGGPVGPDLASVMDSVDVIEAWVDGGATTEEIRERVAGRTGEAPADAFGDDMVGDARILSGYRSAVRAAARRGPVEAGWRRSNRRDAGYVRLPLPGPGLGVVGTMRPSVGHGVLLGGARPALDPPPRGPVRSVTRLRSSLGVGSRRVGAGIIAARGRYHATVAAWEDADRRGRSGLLSLERHGASTVVGLVATWLASAPGGPILRAGSGFACRTCEWGHVSAEVVVAGGRLFGTAVCRAGERGEWVMELFHRPQFDGFSAPAVDPAKMNRDLWGGSVHRDLKIAGVHIRASGYSVVQRRGDLERRRRRVNLSGWVRADNVKWEFAYRSTADVARERSRRAVETAGTTESRGERRARVRATVRLASAGAQRFELQAIHRRRRTGWVLGSRWLGAVGRVALRVQASAYDLPTGTRGYVPRPGIGGYETFGVVGGAGADLSVRASADLWWGVTASAMWVGPWRRAARAYVVVDGRRR